MRVLDWICADLSLLIMLSVVSNGSSIETNRTVNPALLYILEHPLKCRTVKAFTAETVIDIVAHNGDLMFLSSFFNHKPLIFYGTEGISV